LDIPSLVQALAIARDTAYKGVVRPVEGTILTVAKDVTTAAEAAQHTTDNLVSFWEEIVAAADLSVQRTPELLPVLKEAGVVDSGGKGLFFILEGIQRYVTGQTLETSTAVVQPLSEMVLDNALGSIEPGQDYEVIIDFHPSEQLDSARFYFELEKMGTSIQLGEGDGIYRMHIHVPTENLYRPIEFTRTIGSISKIAVENLMEQMGNNQKHLGEVKPILSPVEPGQNAVVAVVPGNGIARVFASLGVAAIVNGGQTMNPSTQEITNAFENLPTDRIIILPNNKNIIMTAKAAGELSVKKVAVIPSCSVPQGLAAMMRLIPDGDFDSVVEEMNLALSDVQTGEITTATRSVEIDGVEVQEGQVIALQNDNLVLSASSLEEACLGLLEKANAEKYELITLFYGSNVSSEEVSQIAEAIRTKYPSKEIEVQEGGQPHYQFIIAIE
jgi:DAK2 domain fusion protein YloV